MADDDQVTGRMAMEASSKICFPCLGKGTRHEAEKYCHVCMIFFCTSCIDTHNMLFVDHRFSETGSVDVPEQCQQHGKVKELYCEEKKTAGCDICISSEHGFDLRNHLRSLVKAGPGIPDLRIHAGDLVIMSDCWLPTSQTDPLLFDFPPHFSAFVDPSIASLFMAKPTKTGWLGGTKMKCVIGFDRVASVLHKSEAPSEVVAKYLKLVDDVEKRLDLAQKMQCHEAVIETYLAQRDRKSLETYQRSLKTHSKEWFHAKEVLSNNSTKWKT